MSKPNSIKYLDKKASRKCHKTLLCLLTISKCAGALAILGKLVYKLDHQLNAYISLFHWLSMNFGAQNRILAYLKCVLCFVIEAVDAGSFGQEAVGGGRQPGGHREAASGRPHPTISTSKQSLLRSDLIRHCLAGWSFCCFVSANHLSPLREVVVALVIEQWHSVWAGRVQIPGPAWAFLVQNSC